MAQMPPVSAERGEVADIVKTMIEDDGATKVVITRTGNSNKYTIVETVPD